MKSWIVDLTSDEVIAEIEGSEEFVVEQAVSLMRNVDNSALTFEEELFSRGPSMTALYFISTDTTIITEEVIKK